MSCCSEKNTSDSEHVRKVFAERMGFFMESHLDWGEGSRNYVHNYGRDLGLKFYSYLESYGWTVSRKEMEEIIE